MCLYLNTDSFNEIVGVTTLQQPACISRLFTYNMICAVGSVQSSASKAGWRIFTLVLALALTMALSPWPWLSLVQTHLQFFSDPFYLPTLNDVINVCFWLSPISLQKYPG